MLSGRVGVKCSQVCCSLSNKVYFNSFGDCPNIDFVKWNTDDKNFCQALYSDDSGFIKKIFF